MPDDQNGQNQTNAKTYTQDEVDAMIAERNKAIEMNRNEVLGENKKLKAKLAPYEGIDLDEVKSLKAAAEEAARKKAAAEGDFTEWQKKHLAEAEKERNTFKAQIDKRNAAIEKRGARAQLAAALTKAGAKPGMLDLLMLEGQRSVRTRETEDDFEEYVADEKGNPLVADAKGTPMTIDLFVEQALKVKYPDAFNGTGSTGSGASKSTAGGGGSAHKLTIAASDRKSFMENVDKIAKGEVLVDMNR